MKNSSSVLDRLVATLFTKFHQSTKRQRVPRHSLTLRVLTATFPALCLFAALGVGNAYAADVTVTAP